MEFNKTTLSKLSIDNKGMYGIGAAAVEYDKNLPTYLRITDITDDGNLIESGLKSVDSPDYKKYILKDNDIVFARTGNSTGRNYFYNPKHGKLVFAGFLIKFSLNDNLVFPKYIKYYCKTKEYWGWVNGISTGSTRKNINAVMYGDMPILLPAMYHQKKIVNILEKFDNKIEINKKIIANLEAQAQALFKYYFIDFEPFADGKFVDSEIGPIPEGWEVKKINDVCDCKLGGTPKKSESTYWDGDIAWINSGEVNKDRILLPTRYITKHGLASSSTKLLKKKTTLIAITGATLGQVSLLEIDSCTNQSIIGIEENLNMPYEYIYLYIKNNINSIISNQTGAAQQHINLNDVKNTDILVPSKKDLKKYLSKATALLGLVSNLYFQNQTLAYTRDALLPKLMAGEIDLENLGGPYD